MLSLRQHKGEWGCFAETHCDEGRPVYIFTPTYIPKRNRYSIQIDGKHMIDYRGKFLNHRCSPNSEIRVVDDTILLYATKTIYIGQEVTFNYNTTESVLAEPFNCTCCGILIRGKRYAESTTK